jgi:hypothetical protein
MSSAIVETNFYFMLAEDREGRPPPCVGICYYKKLQALQAKEDLLASHNYVLKQVRLCSPVTTVCSSRSARQS